MTPTPTQEAESRELLPCPFCGGLPISSYVRDGRVIVCQGCHASAPPAYHGPPDRPSSEERARENWNRRAPPPIPTGGGEPSKNGYTYDPDHYWSPAQLRRWADRESCRVGGDAETARYLCRAADRIEALNAPSPATGAPPPLTVQAGFLPGSENHAEAVKFLAGGVETGEPVAWIYEWTPHQFEQWAVNVSLKDPRAHGVRRYRRVQPLYASPPPAVGAQTKKDVAFLTELLDEFDRENADDIAHDDFNIGQDETIEVNAEPLRRLLALFQGAGR